MSLLLDLLTGACLPPTPTGIVGRIVADADDGGVHICTCCHDPRPDGAFRRKKRPDGSFRRALICCDCERQAQAERDARKPPRVLDLDEPRVCTCCGVPKPLTEYYHRLRGNNCTPLAICKRCQIAKTTQATKRRRDAERSKP